ncbi:alpha-tectorin-like [Epinephelus lanceolatus]
MVKPGALLLLLAVAASFHPSQAEEFDISSCSINYYGILYSKINVAVNSEDKTALACFVDDQSSEITEDCIFMGFVLTSTIEKIGYPESMSLPQFFSTITEDANCHVVLKFKSPTQDVQLTLYQAGSQAALKFQAVDMIADVPSSFEVTARSDGSVVASKLFTPQSLSAGDYIDISGCRYNGIAVKRDGMYESSACSDVTCDVSSGSATPIYACDTFETCVAGACVTPKAVCTVTGSSIIDFNNNEVKVTDRCTYILLKPSSGSSYELVAVFKERRRKDVAFLDHLIFQVSGTKIYVEQGGRVEVDGNPLTLTDQFDTQHGVEIRKVQNEVTFKVPGTSLEVVYDGYSAHVSGPTDSNVKGMCGNPSDTNYAPTLSDLKSSESDSKCGIAQTDDSNDPDCAPITTHCELLNQAPFDSCSEHIATASYISACKSILCHYPDGDGHKCQFFEAYAKSCKLSYDITLDWSSVEGCSSDPHPCHSQHCADHEFCGDKTDGTRCFCRALYADQYPDTFGEPTACTTKTATLTMANCLLEDSGIDHTTLHLRQTDCTGTFDSTTNMVTFHFDDSSNTCGTEVTKEGNNVKYANTITTQDYSNDVIVRHDQVTIDFSCLYTLPELNQVTLKIVDSSVKKTITSGDFTFSLTMSAYTDSQHQNLIDENTDLHLNQKIYVTLMTTGLDSNKVVLVTKSCSAESEEAGVGDSPYSLITDRCGDDSTVEVEGNGVQTSNSFSFNLFQFTGKSGKINLNCEVELCLPEKEQCDPACGSKRKRRSFRSKYDRNSARISMSWNN